MARKTRKHISSTDLTWMFFEILRDQESLFQKGLSFAVVPDTELGWRGIIAESSRKRMSERALRRFKAIEKDLQGRFALKKSR